MMRAGYLLWLFSDHMRSKYFKKAEEGDSDSAAPVSSTLLKTILLLALTDLAFSIDSVAAAVAVSDQVLLIGTGAIVGIVALRFTSGLFIRWLDLYPRLETAGYLAVAFVGLRLIIHVLWPWLSQPDWLTLVVVGVMFWWGLSLRDDRDVTEVNHVG